MLGELKSTLKSETIIGDPITVGEVTIVPVTKISFGFGAGGDNGNKKNAFGGGSGGGASVEPVAFIVITGKEAKILPLKASSASWEKLFDPALYGKIKSTLDHFLGNEDKKKDDIEKKEKK